MKIKCPSCSAAYDMDESRVPAAGLTIKCPRCKNPFRVAKPTAGEASGPAPQAAAPADPAVPLPAPQRAMAPPMGRPPGAMAPPVGPPPGAARAPVGPPRPAAPPAADASGLPPGWAAGAHPGNTGSTLPPVPFAQVAAPPPPPEPTPTAPPTEAATFFQPKNNPFSAAVAAVASRPGPAAEPAPSFELDYPPEPAEPPPEESAASEMPSLDMDLPPPEPPPATPSPGRTPFTLGDTDFGQAGSDPGLDAAAASAGDNNPFQLDLGAPPQPQAASAADALSMLDFDDAGGGAQAPQRWQVRRRSGKVFGPFDGPTIAAMLQQGQLFGTEDISVDGANWSPISAEPEFARNIKSAPEEAKEPPGLAAPVSVPRIPAPVIPVMGAAPVGGPSEEKLEKSALAKPRVPVWARLVVRRLPLLAGMAVVIAIVGGGVALGKFTSFGYFGVNLLKGKHSSGGSSGAAGKALETFNAQIGEGTFSGTQKALAAAQAAVTADPESPEAVMDLALTASRMMRRYGAPRTEVDRAKTLLAKLDPKGVEAKIIEASVALADKKPKEARTLLEPFAKDRRAELLLSEAALEAKDFKAAVTQLDTILAVRASGEAAMQRAEAARGLADEPGERAALAVAIEKVPGHARARLWLARLDVAAGKTEDAEKALGELLSANEAKKLDTSEEALGHHLLGDIFLNRKQINEAAQEYTKAADQDPSNASHRMAAAQILLRRHQWPEAVAAFDKALEKSPGDVALLVGSAKALIETNAYEKANARVEEAKKKAPKDPTVFVAAGGLQIALQHYPDAHKAFAESLKLDEKNVAALVAEGSLYLVEGKQDDAQKSIARAVELDANDPAAQTALGNLKMELGVPKEAREAFEAALKLDADRVEAQAGLARTLDKLNEDAAAGEAYKKIVTQDPRNISYRQSYAEFLKKTGNLDGALEQLKAGLAVDEKDARLQALTGGVLLELDRADEAETALKRALQLRESDPIAHAYYGRLLSTMKGDSQLAVEHLKRSVAAMPKSAEMRYQLGLVYERGQMLGDAMDKFKEAIELDENMLDARQHLGKVLSGQGQFSAAIEEFEKVLDKDPNRAGAVADLADAEFKAGNVDASIKHFKKAISASSKDGTLQYRLGRAYDKKGQTSEAAEAYESATKLDPTNPLPWYYLGYVYKGRTRNKDAVTAFQNYLKYAKDAKDADEINDEIAFLKDAR